MTAVPRGRSTSCVSSGVPRTSMGLRAYRGTVRRVGARSGRENLQRKCARTWQIARPAAAGGALSGSDARLNQSRTSRRACGRDRSQPACNRPPCCVTWTTRTACRAARGRDARDTPEARSRHRTPARQSTENTSPAASYAAPIEVRRPTRTSRTEGTSATARVNATMKACRSSLVRPVFRSNKTTWATTSALALRFDQPGALRSVHRPSALRRPRRHHDLL